MGLSQRMVERLSNLFLALSGREQDVLCVDQQCQRVLLADSRDGASLGLRIRASQSAGFLLGRCEIHKRQTAIQVKPNGHLRVLLRP
jgi:hypothetical protein